jgi:hypothetical protein
MKPISIYLDDERKCPLGSVQTTTVEDTIELLQRCQVKSLSLDHDLGYKKNGYDVLVWIEEQVVKNGFTPPPRIEIHTWNPGARPKMVAAVEAIKDLAKEYSKEEEK